MTPAHIDTHPNVMTVRAREDGHWYVGSGRSIANGPYRRPQHLIDVVSDLMGDNTNWRIEVLNSNDKLIAAYDARELRTVCASRREDPNTWPAISAPPPMT